MLQRNPASSRSMPPRRLRLRVRGVVQGVGFRPFAFGLARRYGLCGFVLNDSEGVLIEIEGGAVDEFRTALRAEAPVLARIDAVEVEERPLGHDADFVIAESRGGKVATRIGADAATCPDCLRELRDPKSRFFGYAFVNCTHCGPRYTITRALPYDRAQTSMAGFVMCPACAADYRDPENRRFHAEPVACPACGPRLSHRIEEIAEALLDGKIVALKGIGGFHLMCHAQNAEAITELRRRKARDEKPFAVMVADIEAARRFAAPSAAEEDLLSSVARPVVLVDRRGRLPAGIAPGLSRIGIMLAYAPVHHLLFDELSRRFPGEPVALVATSANPGGEPLAASNEDAERRLATIADLIVTHDRDILVRADDSVMQVAAGAPAFLRRARGFVPEPVDLGSDGPLVIALGADLKNTVCLTRGREAFLSQHVGGLDNAETLRFQREAVEHLCRILAIRPEYAACDLHPDFRSVRLAEDIGLPLVRVQHHVAHVAAVAAEHRLEGALLGLALDGHGYGADGGIWGGELLMLDGCCWRRAGHLATLPLAGGDRAAREPWRMGVGALVAAGRGDLARETFGHLPEAGRLAAMLEGGMRVAETSSLGRLFDAAAAIAGTRMVQSFEGQAAMEFEALAREVEADTGGYRVENGVVNFRPLLIGMAERGLKGVDASSLFHATLVAGLAEWTLATARAEGLDRVVLSGGCLANRRLAEGLRARLSAAGIETWLPQAVPAGDGGLSLGQAAFARHVVANDRTQVEEP
ncbi:carbamoyltransferase HypF [Ciceribacter thiooxidans]|uniref:Carbamoyltransferase HypF n=1 Tax=Ciceribacter thiooxidans TaxID=1969821 RepID=A0ABV7HW65_9HYPH|nr:carbamoyltransferase HypF [Ciceribacter thiooxidans]